MGGKDLFIQCCGEAVEELSVFLGPDFFGKEGVKGLDISEFHFRREGRQGLGDEGVVDLEKGVGEPRDSSGIFGEKPRKKGHEFRPAEALAKARIGIDRGLCSSVGGPFPERIPGRFAAKRFGLEAVMDIEEAETKGRKARLTALFPRKEGPGLADKGLVGDDPALPEGEELRKEVPPDAPACTLAEGMFPKSMIDPPEFFPDRVSRSCVCEGCGRDEREPHGRDARYRQDDHPVPVDPFIISMDPGIGAVHDPYGPLGGFPFRSEVHVDQSVSGREGEAEILNLLFIDDPGAPVRSQERHDPPKI